MNRFIVAQSKDPYKNLALEAWLFENCRQDVWLYLWQNQNTVVIGRNQNAWKECRVAALEADGGRLARRSSGGGAVYHDLGNLNFTFIVDQDTAPGLNFKIFVRPVVEALARFGVHAEFTGRNDLTIGGMKFSGNSQYAKHGRLLHHGCIMLDSNLTDVADALRVKQAKFDSKAVKSVRSRVTTINTHAPTPIAMEDFKSALRACAMAGGALEPYTLTAEDMLAVNQLKLFTQTPLTNYYLIGNSVRCRLYDYIIRKMMPGTTVTCISNSKTIDRFSIDGMLHIARKAGLVQ
mgnify:CR=1 FL=1